MAHNPAHHSWRLVGPAQVPADMKDHQQGLVQVWECTRCGWNRLCEEKPLPTDKKRVQISGHSARPMAPHYEPKPKVLLLTCDEIVVSTVMLT